MEIYVKLHARRDGVVITENRISVIASQPVMGALDQVQLNVCVVSVIQIVLVITRVRVSVISIGRLKRIALSIQDLVGLLVRLQDYLLRVQLVLLLKTAFHVYQTRIGTNTMSASAKKTGVIAIAIHIEVNVIFTANRKTGAQGLVLLTATRHLNMLKVIFHVLITGQVHSVKNTTDNVTPPV
jgi:hypothetical protein